LGKSAPHDPAICRENRYRRDQFEPETEVTSGAGWLLETASSLPMPFSSPPREINKEERLLLASAAA
jgi:hypothetical protein